MNKYYLEKLSQQGFATTVSTLQQFLQHPYQLQFATIFWCIRGEADFSINGRRYRFLPGCIIACPAGANITLLDITSDFSSRLLGVSETIWISSRQSLTSEAMRAIECHPYKGAVIQRELEMLSNLFRFAELIEEEVQQPGADTEYCLRNIILATNASLLYIQHLYTKVEPISKPHDMENRDETFAQFRNLVSTGYLKERSVQHYSDILGVSTRYLNTVCQRYTGQSAKNLIDKHTVIELQVALMYTHKSFNDLVIEFHFPDQSYLNRYFKRHTGYSLSEFRGNGVMVDQKDPITV